MGTVTTPRHRADVPRTAVWADLRRGAAHILAGRDLSADDAILRPASSTPGLRPDISPSFLWRRLRQQASRTQATLGTEKGTTAMVVPMPGSRNRMP